LNTWLARHYRILPWGYITFISVVTTTEIWNPCHTWWGRLFYWANIPITGLCAYSIGKSTARIEQTNLELQAFDKLEAIVKTKNVIYFNRKEN
jgi:hypothetical protein